MQRTDACPSCRGGVFAEDVVRVYLSGTATPVHREGCGEAISQRTRLAEWSEPAVGPVRLASPLGADAVGAPVVDRSGGLLALVTAADQAMPVFLAQRMPSPPWPRTAGPGPKQAGFPGHSSGAREPRAYWLPCSWAAPTDGASLTEGELVLHLSRG